MEKKTHFYGTPLNRVIAGDVDTTQGLINTRRAKLDQQQIVKDDQGRRRFHGAFTGGFSAGYFNTVDTVEGFKPRQFVTHRGSKSTAHSSSEFSHRPEDYMDDEDLGEFGIAPRKIRISNQYSNNADQISGSSQFARLLKPSVISIGEKILDQMKIKSGALSARSERRIAGSSQMIVSKKDNFHGLGYKPLKERIHLDSDRDSEVNAASSNSHRRLKAVTERGKLLEITGEAFGSGVLEEDDDYLGAIDAYGYDDPHDYEFLPEHRRQRQRILDYDGEDAGRSVIPGFALAKKLDAIELCDNSSQDYPEVVPPDDWKLPTRKEPYVPPVKPPDSKAKLTFHDRQATAFSKKFTSGSALIESDILYKSGLVSYSDLKTSLPKQSISLNLEAYESSDVKASISRRVVEWRPCSLLCKRFNVPNPYPDSAFCGVKTSELETSDIHPVAKLNQDQPQDFAPIELRQSIFNVVFDEPYEQGEKDNTSKAETDSEDEPQVVIIDDRRALDRCKSRLFEDDLDNDPDIVIVTAPKPEPELIELISSSSESTPVHEEDIDLDQHDLYGPPLPPQDESAKGISYTEQLPKRKNKKRHKRHKRKRCRDNYD